MKEELVKFETAVLAKEKGFESYKNCITFPSTIKDFKKSNLAVTQSLLQKWLREIHNIDIMIIPKYKDLGKFYGCILEVDNKKTISNLGSNFKNYEEALEKGLLEGLKLIENG